MASFDSLQELGGVLAPDPELIGYRAYGCDWSSSVERDQESKLAFPTGKTSGLVRIALQVEAALAINHAGMQGLIIWLRYGLAVDQQALPEWLSSVRD